MRRAALAVVGAHVAVAAGTRAAEALEARCCGCPDRCWCRRPGLSLFRWVFPWHHEQAEPGDEGLPGEADEGAQA